MSSPNQKEVGDHVRITAGANKGQEGILQEKVSKGWNIKLQSGEVVLAAFPFIKLLAKAGEFQENLQSEESQGGEPVLDAEPDSNETEEIAGQTTEDSSPPSEEIVDAVEEIEIPDDIKKMTVAQLRDLAKEKGVSIARTKSDFLRIIKKMNTEEDLGRLKGKVLFDRVSEMHISRLRSKEDLQRLLAQK